MSTTKITDEKTGKLIFRYKHILLIIVVIWIFSEILQKYYRNNNPVNILDPSRVRNEVKE